MITMLQSLFAVGIVFLCILTNIRGEQSRVFSTNEHYSWFNARGKCKLLTNESNFSSFSTRRLGWTNFSAKYLPWIEYLGCFEFRNVDTLYSLKKQVTQGEQLQECIVHCNSSQFFGLQKSTCLCLQSSNHTDLYRYIVKSCDTNAATCLGDPFGFCGTEGGREFLSVYQKVNIDEQNKTFIGNCLEFDNRNGRFKANNCATELHPKCYNEVYEAFYTRKSTKTNWTDAFNNCKRGTLASYNTVIGKMKEMGFYAKFWLSNTRRWKRILDGAGYPEFCVAARIQQNGDVERSIHRCSDLLPALCVTSRKTSTNAPSKPSSTLSLVTTFQRKLEQTSISLRRTVPDRKETTAIPTLDFQQTTLLVHEEFSSGLPSNDGYSATVVIATIAATVLMVIVILVTVVMCKRRNTLRSGHHPISVSRTDVVYENTPRNQTTDIALDNMHYQSLGPNRTLIEHNYDTMQSTGTDVTSDTDRALQSDIIGAPEYSQVDVDYEDIENVS